MYRKKRPDPIAIAPEDTASEVSDEREPLFAPPYQEEPHSSSYGAINN